MKFSCVRAWIWRRRVQQGIRARTTTELVLVEVSTNQNISLPLVELLTRVYIAGYLLKSVCYPPFWFIGRALQDRYGSLFLPSPPRCKIPTHPLRQQLWNYRVPWHQVPWSRVYRLADISNYWESKVRTEYKTCHVMFRNLSWSHCGCPAIKDNFFNSWLKKLWGRKHQKRMLPVGRERRKERWSSNWAWKAPDSKTGIEAKLGSIKKGACHVD